MEKLNNLSSRKGETLVGGLLLATGFFYSAIVPAITGYGLASGNQHNDLTGKLITGLVPGPVYGILGSFMEMGKQGATVGLGILTGLEAVSFGVGYGLGCLMR
jgi:hypothetical protein